MATSSEFDRVPDGYPKLAALQAKEQEYMIVRRFRCLNTRNLLYYQSELTDLERQFETLDKQLKDDNASDGLRSWPTFATDSKRRNLVTKMRKLLREYNAAVCQFKEVATISSPKQSHINGLKRWFKMSDPIIDSSMNYLEERCLQGEACVPGRHVQNDYAELLSMNHRADSWIGNYLRHSPLKFFFANDMIYTQDRKDAFMFFNSTGIDKIVTTIAVMTATILTVCAITTLNLTSGRGSGLRMGLIGLFTVMTAAILALAGARKSEVFIGTIGYVAVLVVFVSGGDTRD